MWLTMDEEIEKIVDKAIEELDKELKIATPTFGILSILLLLMSLLTIPIFITTVPLLFSAIIAGLGLVCSIRGILKEDSKISSIMGLILGLIALFFYIMVGLLINIYGFD